jgi:hypothetical protein
LRAIEVNKLKEYRFCKKKVKQSGYMLTSKISTVSEWTKEEIIKRQKYLAEYALKAWPI